MHLNNKNCNIVCEETNFDRFLIQVDTLDVYTNI